MALLLAESCEKIVRGGVFADYVEREEELPVVRGRLLGDRQILRRFGQVDHIICHFDEHDQNVAENQLLAGALAACGRRVGHESVKRRIRRLQAIFEEVCRADFLDLRGGHHQMEYHRLNEHYRDAHCLAWLALDGLGIRDLLGAGETRCFAFLIDMNSLFERFVSRLTRSTSSTTSARSRPTMSTRASCILTPTVTARPAGFLGP